MACMVGAGWYVWLVFIKSEGNTRGSEGLLAFSLLVRARVLEIRPLIKPARTSGTRTPTQGVRMRTAISPRHLFFVEFPKFRTPTVGFKNLSPKCRTYYLCANVDFGVLLPALPLVTCILEKHNFRVSVLLVSLTGNNQRLRSLGDNDRRSKRFCSNAVLCVSFT